MARMHSRKKGKSGSKHPITKVVPKWVQYSKEEIIELILTLAKKGETASSIGMILRDQHAIPSVKLIMGKSIKQILKENKTLGEYPEDLMNLLKKAVKLQKHMGQNKMDVHNKRILQLTESKIKRLVKYYKSKKEIPADWYYKPEQIALIIKE